MGDRELCALPKISFSRLAFEKRLVNLVEWKYFNAF